MNPMRRRATAVLAVLAFSLPSLSAYAQAGGKPLRVVLPLSAGSTVDAVARVMSNPLSKISGHPVMIDNQPGAGGVTGTNQIVRAPKDGMTIGMVSNNHVINPSIYKNMPFDSIKDVTPVAMVGTSPLVLVVHKSVPATNLKELIALAKAKPGDLNYGSSGNGTILHLAGGLLESEAGINIQHVPYKGNGPLVNDLLGGQVQMAFIGTPVAAAHIKSGALRAIGVSTQKRSTLLPDVPTLAEQGLSNYNLAGWIAVIAPAGLPTGEVTKLHGDVTSALGSAEVKEWMGAQDFTTLGLTPDATLQFFQSEQAKYAKLVKQANVTLE